MRFNSRTPGGVRLEDVDELLDCDGFQFTHPGRGATIKKRKGVESDAVSIHAPREGCDVIAESIIK